MAHALPSSVPVLDVHLDSLHDILPVLKGAVANASLVAVDCELSGLGDRRLLRASSMLTRYEQCTRVTQTRAIIALGIACFKLVQSDDSKSVFFETSVFNLSLLCCDDYIVEADSLKFLVEHDFDFNKQYALGLPFYRGNDREESKKADNAKNEVVRDVFALLVSSKKPLVLHNGLIDLVFLYENLYARLPSKLDSFVADLSQLFSQGIYDTKYVADYVDRSGASFLEFLFRLQLAKNAEASQLEKSCIFLKFEEVIKHPNVQRWAQYVPLFGSKQDKRTLCPSYSEHGHCNNNISCQMSHDVDVAIERREGKNLRRLLNYHDDTENGIAAKKRKKMKTSNNSKNGDKETISLSGSSGHRAGYDALMTGFVMASFLIQHAKLGQSQLEEGAVLSPSVIGAEALANRVYLTSKDFPLLVEKSKFANYSAAHHQKYNRIFNGTISS